MTTYRDAITLVKDEVQLGSWQAQWKRPSEFQLNFGLFERIGSQYTHEIIRPEPYTSFRGYSKPTNQKELPDKQALLKKIVKRLGPRYLKPGCRMEFYQNRTDNDRDTIHIFTLWPERWEPNPQCLHWLWLKEHFDRVYSPTAQHYVQDLSGTGLQPVQVQVAVVPAPVPSTGPIRPPGNGDVFSKTIAFSNTKQLREYCEKLLRDGYASGAVGSYMLAMCERNQF